MKRLKTHDFETPQEANDYVETFLWGKPELPKDIWIKILSSNSDLTVQDIQLMCVVNSFFHKLCKTGEIWDEMFRRLYGLAKWEEYQMVGVDFTWMKPSKIKLLRLWTVKTVENTINWSVRDTVVRIFSDADGIIVLGAFSIGDAHYSGKTQKQKLKTEQVIASLNRWPDLIINVSKGQTYTKISFRRTFQIDRIVVFDLFAMDMTTYQCTECQKIF